MVGPLHNRFDFLVPLPTGFRTIYLIICTIHNNHLRYIRFRLFSVFRRTVSRIGMFFNLKLSAPQGESSHHLSKFQLFWVSRFGRVRQQTSKQTHTITNILLLLRFVWDAFILSIYANIATFHLSCILLLFKIPWL